MLLDRGADITAVDNDGWTTLQFAAALTSEPAAITELLDRGASLEARTNAGEVPLHQAAALNSSITILTLLLDLGADINNNGQRRLDGPALGYGERESVGGSHAPRTRSGHVGSG